MSSAWIRAGLRAARVGEDAQKNFLALFEKLEAIVDAGGAIEPREAIEQILADSQASDAVRELAEKILGDEMAGILNRYLRTLEEVEPQDEDRRVFGWPSETWTVKAPRPDFALLLEASGGIAAGAAITIEDDADPFDDPFVTGRLVLTGRIAGEAGARGQLGALGIGAAADASLERTLTHHLSFPRSMRTYAAVAEAIRRLGASIDDLDEMLAAFNGGQQQSLLDRVQYRGRRALSASAEGAMVLPIQGAGTFSGGFSAGISTGRTFAVEMSPGPSEASLRLQIRAGAGRTVASQIEVGYTLGIADLGAGLVKKIAGRLTAADELLGNVDDALDDAETWLKPGSVLKKELGKQLEAKLGGNGKPAKALRAALGDWIGADGALESAETISTLVAQELGQWLDGSMELFEAGTSAQETLRELAGELIGEIGGAAGEALDDALKKAGDWLDGEIDSAANTLDHTARTQLERALGRPLGNVVEDLREYLRRAREKIAEIAAKVAEGTLELLAAQVTWARRFERSSELALEAVLEAPAKGFLRHAIRDPGRAIARAVDGIALDGVTVVSSAMTASGSAARQSAWNVAVLDLPFSASSESLASVRIARTASGVSVGSGARVKKAASLGSDARSVTFADALAMAASGDTETARINLQLTHVDGAFFGGWEGGEIKDFLDPFIARGMLDDGVRDAVLWRFRERRDALGTSRVNGSLTATLALPPNRVPAMLEFAGDPAHRSELVDVVAIALMHDEDTRETFNKAIADALLNLKASRREAFLARIGGQEEDEARFRFVPSRALGGLDEEFLKDVRKLSARSSDWRSEVLRPLEAGRGALLSLERYFGFLNRLIGERRRLRNTAMSDHDLEALRDRWLDENGERIRDLRDHWISAGGLPVLAHPPRRTLALFEVLRELARRSLELTDHPPVVVRFEPEGQAPTFYGADEEDRA